MSNLSFSNDPHRRYNILTREWILCSPHRTQRPWQGKQEIPPIWDKKQYDEDCYLCPGNIRAGGNLTPKYQNTYVFDNDFGALLSGTERKAYQNGLLHAEGEAGICRVICFSPNHSLTIPDMNLSEIECIVSTWQQQYIELGSLPQINHVQIFENKGAIMGCSNPHPHGQIWAQSSIPMEALKKTKSQKAYFQEHKSSLLYDYLQQEIRLKERIILDNTHFVVLVPFWAVWPYETMIIPKRSMQSIGQMTPEEKYEFAGAIKNLTQKYDQLFQVSFPYSMGIHQQPTDQQSHDYWHWHMSFYPPLLRSATVKKFMVGYEMFGEPQRDITAEMAAATLREL